MEDVFKNSPSFILHDDVLEEFIGKGCVRKNCVVGGGLGK